MRLRLLSALEAQTVFPGKTIHGGPGVLFAGLGIEFERQHFHIYLISRIQVFNRLFQMRLTDIAVGAGVVRPIHNLHGVSLTFNY